MTTQDGASPPWFEEGRRGERRRGGEWPDAGEDVVRGVDARVVAYSEEGDASECSDSEVPDAISPDL